MQGETQIALLPVTPKLPPRLTIWLLEPSPEKEEKSQQTLAGSQQAQLCWDASMSQRCSWAGAVADRRSRHTAGRELPSPGESPGFNTVSTGPAGRGSAQGSSVSALRAVCGWSRPGEESGTTGRYRDAGRGAQPWGSPGLL